jgi:hypothetical protein
VHFLCLTRPIGGCLYAILSLTQRSKLAQWAKEGGGLHLGGASHSSQGTDTLQLRSPHVMYPSTQVLNHVSYLYVMVCQASVLQRGADQQSFDTLLLGSQPCLLDLCLVMDCHEWD